jgi:hypothetical protein
MASPEQWLAKLAKLKVDRASGDPAPHKQPSGQEGGVRILRAQSNRSGRQAGSTDRW